MEAIGPRPSFPRQCGRLGCCAERAGRDVAEDGAGPSGGRPATELGASDLAGWHLSGDLARYLLALWKICGRETVLDCAEFWVEVRTVCCAQ